MFKKIVTNLVIYPMMAFVFILQVYFALVIMSAPALAEDTLVKKTEIRLVEPSSLPKNKPATVDTRTVNQEAKDDGSFHHKFDKNVSFTAGPKGVYFTFGEEEKAARKKIHELKDAIKEKAKSGEDTTDLEEELEQAIQGKKQAHEARIEAHDSKSDLEDILVPISLFLFIALAFVAKFYFSYKTRQDQLAVYKMAIEKGQPLPAELPSLQNSDANGSTGKVRSWQEDMSRGIRFMVTGMGVTLFFYTIGAPWAIGAVFVFIGLGQIGSGYIKKNTLPTK